MSLFDTLKKAIFYNPLAPHPPEAPAASKPVTPAASGVAPAGRAPAAPASNGVASASTSAAAPAGTASSPPTAAPVDVEAVLEALDARGAQRLNWRSSIVDLMKLVGIDSSLQHRKELADELGYTGDKGDSAAMNIWLHKAVMRKLAEHGGKVPASLRE